MAEIRTSRANVWASWPGAVAAVLLVAQFFWRGHYLWGGYYFQDDFNMLRIAAESELTWSYLMQEYAGHLWPGNFLMAWWTARLDPTSWTLTATSILLLQLAAGAMMWLVLSRITPDWRIRLPLLVGYLTCPLTLWPTQWWASAIGFVPLALFLLVAVWGLLRRIQDDWAPGSLVAVLATFVGLISLERALLYLVVLGGVAVVLTEGSVVSRLRSALVTYWRLWVALVVLAAGWMVLHVRIAPIDPEQGAQAEVDVLATLADFIFGSFLPGLAGGPWGGAERVGGALSPSVAAMWVGSAVTLVALAFLAWRTRTSGRLALLVVVVYLIGDIGLAFGGRSHGVLFGLFPRYVADALPMTVIAIAFALADVRPRREEGLRVVRAPRWTATPTVTSIAVVAASVAYVASAAWSTAVIAPMEQAHASRAYVANLRKSIRANPRSVIYDRAVPEEVMTFLFGDEGRVSTVLATAPERPVFGVISEELLIPGPTGILEKVDFGGTQDMNPGEERGDCGYALDLGAEPVLVMPEEDDGLESGALLRLSYYTAADTLVTVWLDDRPQSFLARGGMGQVLVVVDEPTQEVRLESRRDSSTVCVSGLESGFPRQVM
jgi:hypothetical protein